MISCIGVFRVTNGDKPRLLLDSLVLGIIGGLSAQVFTWMLRGVAEVISGMDGGVYAAGGSDRWRACCTR